MTDAQIPLPVAITLADAPTQERVALLLAELAATKHEDGASQLGVALDALEIAERHLEAAGMLHEAKQVSDLAEVAMAKGLANPDGVA